ncbi:hypothetical protein H9L13_08455 [Sphingomonas lutea]|uniref:Peptidase inhibitor I78 family protein n=1 Tax=Sphingomonas lutea TaxID=1045317 RepID=A0A7G9SFU0_9SPHN|nr:I78 family peptidase inhibitor [Sphingomonas lutea]QNN66715.1 hypothetical protein H9L13_08455 [Sphingomonas lutea]
MRNLAICSVLALGACAAAGQTRVVGIDQVPPGSTCVQSGALDSFKGEMASTELGARIMGAARAPNLRWVPHGAMVTMEYNARRVTVQLDPQNRVLTAKCG